MKVTYVLCAMVMILFFVDGSWRAPGRALVPKSHLAVSSDTDFQSSESDTVQECSLPFNKITAFDFVSVSAS